MRLVDIEPIVELVKGEHEKVQDSFNKANLWKEPNSVARYGEALQEIGAFIGLMINAPTVDAVPVRHGKWVKDHHSQNGFPSHIYMMWKCSECSHSVDNPTPYCPNCGTKMDGERKEE